MYLATVERGETTRYCIRNSYFDVGSDSYSYRQIFDLGENPGQYIEYHYGDVLCFNESLAEAVAAECQGDPDCVLEDMLWRFLSFAEQQRIRTFRRNAPPRLTPLTEEEKQQITKSIHIFDRRRLYYIRYGAVDQSRIGRINEKLYRPLLGMCRDEKEYYFKSQEQSLKSAEYKKYVFVIFNLQLYFSESYASYMPEALDEIKLEDAFVEQFCSLQRDPLFRQGMETDTMLHQHLRRYLVIFFDTVFEKRSFSHDYYRAFRAAHRKFTWPHHEEVSEKRSSEIFGETYADLKKMNPRELARLFRKKAKEYHPDSGGESEKFITLLKAYEDMKRQKP